MLINILSTTLKTALEFAVLAGVIAGCSVFFGRKNPASLRNLMVLAFPTAGLFAYFVLPNLDQRSYDLVVSLASSIALLAILALIWFGWRQRAKARVIEGRWLGWLISLLTAVAIFGNLVKLALVPESFFTPAITNLTTEVISNLAVFTAGLALSAALLLTIAKSVGRLGPFWSVAWATLALFPILIGQLTATVQMLLVSGRIVLTMFGFSLIAWLINSRTLLLNISLGTLLVLAAALGVWRPTGKADLNPAQRRRIRAGRRLNMRLIGSLTFLAAISGLVLGSESVFAGKDIALSPAKEVKAEQGKIRLPLKTIKDKRLHRFAFDDNGRKIRFIVVHKGSGVYGSGFDACVNCGTVGYYEKDANIICKNCDAYINIATLGFPGGCNPIPLPSSVVGERLEIDVNKVTASKEDWR